jgi:acyl transferase domain-containing protein
MRRALAVIDSLRAELSARDLRTREPIAIVGAACRFPGGASDLDSYWELLAEGRDAIGDIPPLRFDADALYADEPAPGKMTAKRGGFLDGIEQFDHEFFGLSAREAAELDPQHRLVLVTVWEALEEAGINPDSLRGSATSVILGLCGTEYSERVFGTPEGISAYASTGNAHSVAAGRVSYLLDLRGPSTTVDTACSSSLVAVHQAVRQLRSGEVDMSLCGGANVVLSPRPALSFSQFPDMLARDGRCKTFDAAADGFSRSDGAGIVVLKRLSDARRDGDRVLAVIRGSALGQDGRSSGLTAPNGAAQRDVFRKALADAGVTADDIAFIETHGAGTKLGDPIEVDAVSDIYGRAGECYLGAVKTNLGHTESAAGIAGLIKTVLCVQRGLIPPNINFSELNPHITLAGTGLRLPSAVTAWPARADDAAPRRAAVSSFGISGVNAHIILEQAPAQPARTALAQRGRQLLTISAKTDAALVKLARRYRDVLAGADERELAAICQTANTGRAHLPLRLAVSGASAAELREALADYEMGEDGAARVGRAAASGVAPVFLFTGQGPQRPGMARQLYLDEPVFRETVEQCAAAADAVLPQPLLSAIFAEDPESALIHDMSYAQPALFAVELGLARLWASWGVRPAAVIGHSLGEYAAACFAGVMSLEDGARLVAKRGALLQRLASQGAMATIFAGSGEVAAEVVLRDAGSVSIAALNSPSNTVISGTHEVVEDICGIFEARGAQTRRLRISTSSHSPLIEPVLAELAAALSEVALGAPQIPLYCNVTGELWPWTAPMDAGYWLQHARQPVLFEAAVRQALADGHRAFVEVGPSPSLLGLAADCLASDGDLAESTMLVPSLRPRQDDWSVLLDSVAALHVAGTAVDFAAFANGAREERVTLPHYPFAQTRCWHEQVGQSWPAPGAPTEPAPRESTESSASAPQSAPATRGRAAIAFPGAAEVMSWPAELRAERLVEPLAAGVRRTLGGGAADPDQPLLELGLDSLMAVELRAVIRTAVGVDVPVASFLAGGTITSIAAEIAAEITARPQGPESDSPGIARVARAPRPALAAASASASAPDSMGTHHD